MSEDPTPNDEVQPVVDDEMEPVVEVSEDHVGKPLLTADTYIVGTITGVQGNAYLAEEDPGADMNALSTGLVSSGDGKLAVMPGQIDRITEDGVFLK